MHLVDRDCRPDSKYPFFEKLKIPLNAQGNPPTNEATVVRILTSSKILKGSIYEDTFLCRLIVEIDGVRREFNETDSLALLVELQEYYFLPKLKHQQVYQSVVLMGRSQKRDELTEYFTSLRGAWDGWPRVEEFLNDAFGAEDSCFNRAVSKNLIIAIAARALKPGCKMDNLVVLEGLQGAGKSTALRYMGLKWFAEISEQVGTKDFYISMQGVLIGEISELSALTRAGVEDIKRTLSSLEDRFRPPYGKTTESRPRRIVLIGTTNSDEYLKDPTGARRFWPVAVRKIDLKYIEENVSQLYAEAVHWFDQGATWWDVPDDEAKLIQASREDDDVWLSLISEWLDVGTRHEISIIDVLQRALQMAPAEINHGHKLRVSRCLKKLGWASGGPRHTSGRTWTRSVG